MQRMLNLWRIVSVCSFGLGRGFDLRSEVISKRTSANATDDRARVANCQEIVAHASLAVVFRKLRDVVEGEQHATVNEEEGKAEAEESDLHDGLQTIHDANAPSIVGMIAVIGDVSTDNSSESDLVVAVPLPD